VPTARVAHVAWLLLSLTGPASAQDGSEAHVLVGQLGRFPAAIEGRVSSRASSTSVEQRRAALYVALRNLGGAAIPALQQGLRDPDVQVRRNVALYLSLEGGGYAKRAEGPLAVAPFLPQLVVALEDGDARVTELAAQAVGHAGAKAAIAVPSLIRLLEHGDEGARNSACLGLGGIGPAARDALPALRRALADPRPDVRGFAQRAIDTIERAGR
jgi:HEAT repeat protein